jgi:hypothetical protein
MAKEQLLVRGKLKLHGIVDDKYSPDDVLRDMERCREPWANWVPVDGNDIDSDVSETQNDDRPCRDVLPLL